MEKIAKTHTINQNLDVNLLKKIGFFNKLYFAVNFLIRELFNLDLVYHYFNLKVFNFQNFLSHLNYNDVALIKFNRYYEMNALNRKE